MGDIFRRETAEHPEPFTGERLTAAVGGQVQIEHYHRYLFARSFVAGRDVLDVASGEGYGSALLAQVARTVVGAEYAGPTVLAAAVNFRRPNLHFVQSDARALPLADGSIDIVTSFETIEHFDRQSDFLREIRRVLRSDGCFIVSTPDRDTYSPAGSQANPFHVCELSRQEFVSLLQEHFRHVVTVQQRALIGSALLADSASPASPLVFDRRGNTHFEACIGLPRAPYVVAVASDSELPPLPPSIYIDRSDVDTETVHRITLSNQLQQAQADVAQATERAEQAVQRADVATEHAEQATRQAQEAIQQAQQADAHMRQAAERARQAEERAQQAEERAQQADMRAATITAEYNTVRYSLRQFLRRYLPHLRRHLFGHRP